MEYIQPQRFKRRFLIEGAATSMDARDVVKEALRDEGMALLSMVVEVLDHGTFAVTARYQTRPTVLDRCRTHNEMFREADYLGMGWYCPECANEAGDRQHD